MINLTWYRCFFLSCFRQTRPHKSMDCYYCNSLFARCGCAAVFCYFAVWWFACAAHQPTCNRDPLSMSSLLVHDHDDDDEDRLGPGLSRIKSMMDDKDEQPVWSRIAYRMLVSSVVHPFEYAKILIQVRTTSNVLPTTLNSIINIK